MRVVQINSVCGVGSTGRICVGISQAMDEASIESSILYTHGYSTDPHGIRCGNAVYTKCQALLARITGKYGLLSYCQTRKIINELDRLKPDLVHIHNIHGHDCNVETLLDYLKKENIKTVFTLHDCWLFTGYCTHFAIAKCDKWIKGCHDCPQYKKASFWFDRSWYLQSKKQKAFDGLDATIITPSIWLAGLTNQSFLKQFPTRVIPNGIDLSVFKPTEGTFREEYGIGDKYMILGVAFDWGVRKGLDVFVELANRLGSDYQIVLVGTNSEIDKQLPNNIISVHRTQSQTELAQMYTTADIFVNPTREDNYPTVNMEALACGTPVITFRTGGSPECIDETCGSVVDCDDVTMLEQEVRRVCCTHPYTEDACRNRALAFDSTARFREYVMLYEELQ